MPQWHGGGYTSIQDIYIYSTTYINSFTIYSIIFLMVVVVGCNSGVETGDGKTGSQYNGEVYSPMNVGDY